MVIVSLLLALICFSVGVLSQDTETFGTYYRLFGRQSLWNSRPINPVFNNDTRVRVQPSINGWFPTIQGGAFSTGIFLAKASDPAVIVYGRTSSGINDVDALQYVKSVTIPHWPSDSVPATGDDGHLDIFDETTGRLHSFWQLRKNATNHWVAQQYAWSNAKADGYGWGDAGHYFQGARAAGVPTSAGIIRKHEAIDSKPMFYHALAMSLAHNSLGFAPGYIYPATSADTGYANDNSGYIPEGALLMLPSTYNTSVHNSFPKLKKVAETLKTYGAYVVDRNTATPYAIYVENGASFKISNLTGWDNNLASQLQVIRAALRMVVNASSYVDGTGKPLPPRTKLNVLSLRNSNTWLTQYGDAKPRFDTWSQSVVYDGSNTQASSHANTNGLGYNKVNWGHLVVNKTYIFEVKATGQTGQPGMIIQLLRGGVTVAQSPVLSNGQSFAFKHVTGGYLFLIARKPIGGPGSVGGVLYSNEASYAPPTSSAGSRGTFGSNSLDTTAG